MLAINCQIMTIVWVHIITFGWIFVKFFLKSITRVFFIKKVEKKYGTIVNIDLIKRELGAFKSTLTTIPYFYKNFFEYLFYFSLLINNFLFLKYFFESLLIFLFCELFFHWKASFCEFFHVFWYILRMLKLYIIHSSI